MLIPLVDTFHMANRSNHASSKSMLFSLCVQGLQVQLLYFLSIDSVVEIQLSTLPGSRIAIEYRCRHASMDGRWASML